MIKKNESIYLIALAFKTHGAENLLKHDVYQLLINQLLKMLLKGVTL
jgi:hypothetical protein